MQSICFTTAIVSIICIAFPYISQWLLLAYLATSPSAVWPIFLHFHGVGISSA